MSAVSIPIPITRASRRTIACGPWSGCVAKPSCRASSISLICPTMNPRRAMSRRSSARVFGGEWCTFRGAQGVEALRGVAHRRLEAPDAKTGQAGLHPVHDAGALADQALPLAVRPPGVLLFERGHRGHGAVARSPTQPAEEDPFEQRGIEPVRLRSPVFTRDGHTCRV